jgi:hypothetical protein
VSLDPADCCRFHRRPVDKCAQCSKLRAFFCDQPGEAPPELSYGFRIEDPFLALRLQVYAVCHGLPNDCSVSKTRLCEPIFEGVNIDATVHKFTQNARGRNVID